MKNNKGFTVLEILIAMVVIFMLSVMGIAVCKKISSQKQGRSVESEEIFDKIESQFVDNYRITTFRHKESGVYYLRFSGGVTIMLDKDGEPLQD